MHPRTCSTVTRLHYFFSNCQTELTTSGARSALAGRKELQFFCAVTQMEVRNFLRLLLASKKPWSFKNVKSLRCLFKSTPKAWMKSTAFTEFLRAWHSELGVKNRSVLLLLGRCSAHPATTSPPLVNIKIQFSPANVTSKPQPLDQGIIRSLNVHYHRKVVQYLLICLEIVEPTTLARVDLLEAMRYVVSPRNAVSPATISAYFSKASVFCTDDRIPSREADDVSDCDEEDLQLLSRQAQLEDPCTFDELVDCDNEVPTSGMMTDECICNEVSTACDGAKDVVGEENTEEECQAPPSNAQVISALETIRAALNARDTGEAEYQLFGRLESFLVSFQQKSVQTTILQYFSRS